MPLKREASGSPAPSAPAKITKLDNQPDSNDLFFNLKNASGAREFDLACESISAAFRGRDSTIINLKLERAKLTLQLSDAAKSRDKAVATLKQSDEQYRLDLESRRKQLIDNVKKQVKPRIESLMAKLRKKSENMNKALQLAEGLSKDIESWKDATKNLNNVRKDPNAIAGDMEGAEQSAKLPDYLLDPEVAQKIADHYTHRVTESVQDICGYLKQVEQEEDKP